MYSNYFSSILSFYYFNNVIFLQTLSSLTNFRYFIAIKCARYILANR